MSGSEDEDSNDSQLKVTLIGDGTCGKTSLCTRLTQEGFDKQYQQTLGLDFFLKRLQLPGHSVTLQVWDIGGQQLSGKMLHTYLYGANAILLIYDITNHDSFDNLHDWLNIVKETFANEAVMPYLALIGNKKDLEHLRVVKKELHHEFANTNGMTCFNISAKSGDKVEYCFQKVAADILGIQLSKHVSENSSRVIKADIVKYSDNDTAARSTTKQPKSTFCSIQ